MDFAAMQAKCSSGVLDLFNISSQAVFGTYGNSPFMQPWQWTALAQGSVQAASVLPEQNKCTLTNIFNVEILYAPTGAVGDEQYKILTARLQTAQSDWTYQHEREAASVVEYFPVRATVTWVPVSDSAYSEFVPEPPNPFPKLDADILYPFSIPSAAPRPYAGAGATSTGVVALAAALAACALAAGAAARA